MIMPFLAVLDAHTGFAEHEEEGEQLAVVTREPFGVSCNNRINQSARQPAINRWSSGRSSVMPLTPASA